MSKKLLDKIQYDMSGLVPAIIQDQTTGQVLMLAYMNKDALKNTISTGVTWFYSRKKNRLWQKGETSGNIQLVKGIYCDCDYDALLIKVEQIGVSCHTGARSCFNCCEPVNLPETNTMQEQSSISKILFDLYDVINTRKEEKSEASYTKYLFEKGLDKILKKVGEECAETIIAAKNGDNGELRYEMADLWYHCLVLLAWYNITPSELLFELIRRRNISNGEQNRQGLPKQR